MSTSLLAAAHLDTDASVGTALFWIAFYLLIPVVAAQFPATRYYDTRGGGPGWTRLRRTDVSRAQLVAEVLAAGAAATAGSLFVTMQMGENIYDITTLIPFPVLAFVSAIPAVAAVSYTARIFLTTNDRAQEPYSASLLSADGGASGRANSNTDTQTEATR